MTQSEMILDALGLVDEELVLDAGSYRRTTMPVFRRLLIAACLGAMLIGTAFAAESIWGVFTRGIRPDPQTDNLELFELQMKGTACFELDEVLADIAVLAEKRDNDPDRPPSGRANVASFESWQAAGEYIGIPLAENAFLAQYPQSECLVGPTADEKGNPLFLCVSSSYLVKTTAVFVDAYLRTNHAGEESRYPFGISYDFSAAAVESHDFRMPDGSHGVILTSVDDSAAIYVGAFIREGILYWVSMSGGDGEDNVALLQQILAAYE